MEFNRISINDILKIVENKYKCHIDETRTSAEELVLRLPLSSSEEAEQFRSDLSFATCTQWAVYNTISTPNKYVYHKTWKCCRSSYRKTSASKQNASCTAIFGILIKKLTRSTIKRDAFLKLNPPLRAVVKLSLVHTHSFNSKLKLDILPVTKKVKREFYSYFNNGLKPREAIFVHQNRDLDSDEQIIYTDMVPTSNQVYYLHKNWKSKNCEPCIEKADVASMEEKLKLLEELNRIACFIEEDLSKNLVQQSIQTLQNVKKKEDLINLMYYESDHTCTQKDVSPKRMKLVADKEGTTCKPLVHKLCT